MLPYIHIGQLNISVYYSAMFLGYVMMVVLMLPKSRRKKYDLSKIKAFGFATAELITGIIGCKILFILENIAQVKETGITLGGFSFYGSVFLIPLIMPLVGMLIGLNWQDALDNAAVCILAMLATIRIGCFFNGCCGGEVFYIGDHNFAFPTQLIECFFDFLILSYLLIKEKQNQARGLLYPIFLFLYGCIRFLIEFLRDTGKDWLYLSHAQWFSVAAIIISITFLILQKNLGGHISGKKK